MDRSLNHCRLYSKNKLTRSLDKIGFSVFLLNYINFVGILGFCMNTIVFGCNIPPMGQHRSPNILKQPLTALGSFSRLHSKPRFFQLLKALNVQH
jgi:hypothetical protein